MSDFSNPLLDDEDEEFTLPQPNVNTGLAGAGGSPVTPDSMLDSQVFEAGDVSSGSTAELASGLDSGAETDNKTPTAGGLGLPSLSNFNPLKNLPLPDPDDRLVAPEEEPEAIVADPVSEFGLPEFEDVDVDLEDYTPANYDSEAVGKILDNIDADLIDELISDDLDSDYGTLKELFGNEPEDVDSEEFHADWDSDDEEDEDPLQGYSIDEILGYGIDIGASDVHVIPNTQIAYTQLGSIIRSDQWEPIPGEVTERIQQAIISHVLESDFVVNLELDASYVLKTGPHKGRRTRLNLGRTFNDVFLVFRIISDNIPSLESQEVEEEIIAWTKMSKGLVLVNGATGSGKTTLIAGLLRNLQLTTDQKIVTIEKPIEFVYPNDSKALVVQREVGPDTRSFYKALDSTMRQNPDRILIGEVRNKEEVDAMIQSAESGHWAISSIHANSASTVINRIKSLYEGSDQIRILGSLSTELRGMVNQVLVKTVDEKSRFAVREILSINTGELREMIRQGDTRALRAYQESKGLTMEHALVRAVESGRTTAAEARKHAEHVEYFDQLLLG